MVRLIFISLLLSAAMQAQGDCKLPQLMNQGQDVATIQRLESAWSVAYLHGDTEFMRCLLVPNFTEILRSGEVKHVSDELAMAAKNRGKNTPIPELPVPEVLMYENVAVAHGSSMSEAEEGSKKIRMYSDSYLWSDGGWHVFFSQQTEAPAK